MYFWAAILTMPKAVSSKKVFRRFICTRPWFDRSCRALVPGLNCRSFRTFSDLSWKRLPLKHKIVIVEVGFDTAENKPKGPKLGVKVFLDWVLWFSYKSPLPDEVALLAALGRIRAWEFRRASGTGAITEAGWKTPAIEPHDLFFWPRARRSAVAWLPKFWKIYPRVHQSRFCHERLILWRF